MLPVVTSWLVNALEAVVDTVPVVGEDWVIVTGFTVSAKLHAPASTSGSASVPVTLYVAAGRVPLVVTAPLEDTITWVECAEVPSA